ncbi:MAG TPA: hypothetical protein VGQ91_16895 [Ideonella sp.]|jgi:hypothetical protein|nr:hypothetical protein [Ideonella sp.]
MNTNGWRVIASSMLCAALLPGVANASFTTFTSQPSDVVVTPGQDARFDADSIYDNSSQWQVSSDNGLTWQSLPGRNFTQLVLPAVTLADNGKQYRRRIFNAPDVVVSRAAILTVADSTPRRLTLLAGAIGGQGSLVDNLVGSNLRFENVEWLSTDAAGNVYVGQESSVYKIDPSRRAQALAGRKTAMGSKDGKGGAASFLGLHGSVVATNGDVYITDANAVRRWRCHHDRRLHGCGACRWQGPGGPLQSTHRHHARRRRQPLRGRHRQPHHPQDHADRRCQHLGRQGGSARCRRHDGG